MWHSQLWKNEMKEQFGMSVCQRYEHFDRFVILWATRCTDFYVHVRASCTNQAGAFARSE